MPSNDEKLSPLLEWLKRFWLPLSGFVSAVTLLVEFLNLWRGNQAVVSWIFFSLGYLLLIGSIGYIAFAKQQSPVLPSRKIHIFSRLYKPAQWALLVTLLMPLIIISVSLLNMNAASNNNPASFPVIVPSTTHTPSLNHTPAPTYTPSLTPTPAPTPTSCNAAIIISPQEGTRVRGGHDFNVEWEPSYCIMTIQIETEGILEVATYRYQESGQSFFTAYNTKIGMITVRIWPYDVDHHTKEPIDIVTFVDCARFFL